MVKTGKICGVAGCVDICAARGYCRKHYDVLRHRGTIKVTYRHGRTMQSKHPLYRCWASMKNRCYNPKDARNHAWHGARGIRVCERWQGPDGFNNFVIDMGSKPSPTHSIDRIDNDGNYEPNNCKWSTPKEQAQNRRPRSKIQKELALILHD